ncbi:hypothetical protein DWF00_04465 [Bosea caraganae]|uniref:Uncharacterized protein n=1 Tax=Bosea caraganae TaxID=2763117 RepID=A0A370KZJ4_9HYPH|nr:hypothetical protein [Bosea caraganae]RDJ20425.1 hypothetical protein DWE98_24175 [Bosea caraganae]RDJ29941.1 hypothetical protein DWF00_04465 [Bosea caraganae]
MPRLAGALALALSAAACTAGDFGRPRPGVWNDVIVPSAGLWSATARGETVSPFRMTDDEEQLRDRAWRFVMPAHERSFFERQVSDFAHSRVLPVEAQSSTASDYFHALTGGSYRSQASRYNRLAEDANADRLLIGPFRANAGRVVAADRVRMRAVDASPQVPPEQRDPAFARVVENEGLILWVCERVNFRIESYRYALANLVVEMPSREAIRAERSIMALEAEAGPLCKLDLIGAFRGGAKPAPADKPVVYKG